MPARAPLGTPLRRRRLSPAQEQYGHRCQHEPQRDYTPEGERRDTREIFVDTPYVQLRRERVVDFYAELDDRV